MKQRWVHAFIGCAILVLISYTQAATSSATTIASPTATATATQSVPPPSATPTATKPAPTPSTTPTATRTNAPTSTGTPLPTATSTSQPTVTKTSTVKPATASPTNSATPIPTDTPAPSPTGEATATPTPTDGILVILPVGTDTPTSAPLVPTRISLSSLKWYTPLPGTNRNLAATAISQNQTAISLATPTIGAVTNSPATAPTRLSVASGPAGTLPGLGPGSEPTTIAMSAPDQPQQNQPEEQVAPSDEQLDQADRVYYVRRLVTVVFTGLSGVFLLTAGILGTLAILMFIRAH